MTDAPTILADQPTAAPTRKMAAVGVAALVAPVVAALVLAALPDLSQACGDELGGVLTASGGAAFAGAAAFASGYLRRNVAPVILRAGVPVG